MISALILDRILPPPDTTNQAIEAFGEMDYQGGPPKKASGPTLLYPLAPTGRYEKKSGSFPPLDVDPVLFPTVRIAYFPYRFRD